MAPRSVIIFCSSCLLAQQSHTQWTNTVYLIKHVINHDDNFISVSTAIWEPHNLRRLGLFLFTREATLISFHLMLYGFTFSFSNFPHRSNTLTVDKLRWDEKNNVSMWTATITLSDFPLETVQIISNIH